MSQNWDQAGWWNQPLGQPEQAQPPAQQQQEPPQQSAEDVVRQIARETLVQTNQEYAEWSRKRRGEYEQVSVKFLADKELAPYYGMALDYFQDQNTKSGERVPVPQLFDATVQYVQRLKGMGVKPPEAPRNQGGSFQSGSQNYDIPLQEQQARRGFPTEDPEKVRQAQQEYLWQRRLDLDRRKSRGSQEDLDLLEKLRAKQYENSVQLEKA